jgi:hypothetical protein
VRFCNGSHASSYSEPSVISVYLVCALLKFNKSYTVIPQFMSLIRFSKTARKAKTCKTKINFPLLPNGNSDQFARGKSSYK